MLVKRLCVGRLETNCYLLYKEQSKQCIIIDPGADANRIKYELSLLGLTPAAILLTHAHIDHYFAMWPLFEAYQMPVYVSIKDTADIVNPGPQKFVPPPGTKYVDDGDTISEANIEVKVMSCPGHTPGSVAYITHGSVFSGDCLFKLGCGRCDYLCSSPLDMADSLKRFASLPDDYLLYPGHYDTSTIAFEKHYNKYLDTDFVFDVGDNFESDF